jgi:hypothetical protein
MYFSFFSHGLFPLIGFRNIDVCHLAQVAGVSFAFEPEAPPGKRVPFELIRVGDEYLTLDGLYSLATKAYLHSGCDGYTMLKNTKVLLGEEVAPELGMAIQNHFQVTVTFNNNYIYLLTGCGTGAITECGRVSGD